MRAESRNVLLGLIATVAIGVALAWYVGLRPAVIADEILHPVRPGISVVITVSNDTTGAAPSFAVDGPTRSIPVGSLATKQHHTVQLDDPTYGDIALRDTMSGARYVILGEETGHSGVGGALTVYWGDDLNGQSSGSVWGGPFRYSPRQWTTHEGVWPLTEEAATGP